MKPRPCQARRSGPRRRSVLILGLCLLGTGARAEDGAAELPPAVEATYLHVAVMGAGTYSINGQRLTMFRLPFKKTRREVSERQAGVRWLYPVTVGYDDLTGIDLDFDAVERLLPDQLVTLAFMPGVEWIVEEAPGWRLKPFVQLGGGHDFSVSETFAMTHFGLRSLAYQRLGRRWHLRFGNALRWGIEYRFDARQRQSFGVFETGLDLRRDTPFELFGEGTDLGTYAIYRRFLPRWRIGGSVEDPNEARDLLELGFSAGLSQRRRFLGIPFRRLRLGFAFGESFRGVTFGTGFPF